jgi:tellurite methyltransferase
MSKAEGVPGREEPQAPVGGRELNPPPSDWPLYFKNMAGKPPRETLLFALDRFDAEGLVEDRKFAVDLGCGEGRDTLELLRRGWRVLATDQEAGAFEHLRPRVPEEAKARLETRVESFREVRVPAAMLVNASFSLPFCEAEVFPELWARIVAALPVGGRFSGQFFGDRDEWAGYRGPGVRTVHHTRSEVERMLDGFVLEFFKEEDKAGKDPYGNAKWWHVFHVVGRRR